MKVSICITVKNEEKTIIRLLESLIYQTKKPDEIIIVDGGSQDKTVQIIEHYQKKYKNILLLKEKCGIAKGRNLAIEVSKNNIIAQIDAGCIAKKNWLEKIIKPLRHNSVGVSAGFYIMTDSSDLQKAQNLFMGVHPKKYDSENYLPSARSVAFKKEVWEEVGGYDERLQKGGEDTKFFISCVKNKIRIVRVGEAKVIWEETKNMSIKDFYRKIFGYAKGDAETKIWKYPIPNIMSHNIKIIFVYLRYILGFILVIFSCINPPLVLLLLVIIVLYFSWSIWKFRDIIGLWGIRLWIPIVQIVSDIAVMHGFASGLLK